MIGKIYFDSSEYENYGLSKTTLEFIILYMKMKYFFQIFATFQRKIDETKVKFFLRPGGNHLMKTDFVTHI